MSREVEERLRKLVAEGFLTPEEADHQLAAAGAGGALHGDTEEGILSGDTATPAGPDAGPLPAAIGAYRVIEEIGRGGMGLVVRARHKEEAWAARQGDVAIKLIHPRLAADQRFRDRFVEEALTLRDLEHPNLVGVVDVVTEPRLGIIMPFVAGLGLDAYVRPGGLAVPEVLALLRPIAETIDHLHAAGVVHRDLKPANIKIRPDGRPVLLDFGIARSVRATTADGVGTIGWMAPEQLDGEPAGPASDRYAFAQIAYVLLAGRLPWPERTSKPRIQSNKLVGQLEPLASARPELAGRVSAAVMRGLAVAPGDRASDALALVDALAAAQRSAEEGRRLEAERRAEAEWRRAEEAARSQCAKDPEQLPESGHAADEPNHRRCGHCGRGLAAVELICPACGWIEASGSNSKEARERRARALQRETERLARLKARERAEPAEPSLRELEGWDAVQAAVGFVFTLVCWGAGLATASEAIYLTTVVALLVAALVARQAIPRLRAAGRGMLASWILVLVITGLIFTID